jgi:hypothetical protein
MFTTNRRRLGAVLLSLALFTAIGGSASAQKQYDTGASDCGNTRR